MPSGSSRGDDAAVARRLDRLRRFARLQDSRFSILGFRFGWDALIGLVPGIGDGLTTAMAFYPIVEAARLGAPKSLLLRMSLNVAVDGAVGLVPVAGDLFDAAWRANLRNVRLLERHLEVQRSDTTMR